MVPALQPEIELVEVDGVTLVIADVPELPRAQEPCYIKTKGQNQGSFIRVGESDRKLTSEEVQQLIADRGQPQFDQDPVLEASLDDLDPQAVTTYTTRMRTGTNSRIVKDESEDVILRMTKVVSKGSDSREHPTLAGLLALGRYPQQFLPQLNVTFVYYPTTEGTSDESGVRFLDNASIDGPIPTMASEEIAYSGRESRPTATATPSSVVVESRSRVRGGSRVRNGRRRSRRG